MRMEWPDSITKGGFFEKVTSAAVLKRWVVVRRGDAGAVAFEDSDDQGFVVFGSLDGVDDQVGVIHGGQAIC